MAYIGKRPGVVLNDGMKHGLFGVMDGKKVEESESLREPLRRIEAKTRAGTIAYRAVISFAEADALRLGYDDPERFRELVRASLPDMCEKIGIPIQNLEYAAALHRDKGHPHCHIFFRDKAQDVKKRAFVKPEASNAIRIGIVKHVFGEEMAELQALKNEARNAVIDNANGFFGEFANAFAGMTPNECAAAAKRLKRGERDLADGSLIYGKFGSADMRELAADLLGLAEGVPETGRLHMKLMPAEVKAGIRAFVGKVLEKNADCDREFKKYVFAARELCKYCTDKPEAHEKAAEAAYDDMTDRLGNAVLRTVKKINGRAREKAREEKRGARRRETVESLVTELFGILARSADAEERKLAHAHRSGELSKQAKKELATKLENSGSYDWER
ncbi:MAG: relaxase MobL [Clostridiales Family XIII bacterium]|nr:relaxase MobL [Clostridiales Family XIII bacterium]